MNTAILGYACYKGGEAATRSCVDFHEVNYYVFRSGNLLTVVQVSNWANMKHLRSG